MRLPGFASRLVLRPLSILVLGTIVAACASPGASGTPPAGASGSAAGSAGLAAAQAVVDAATAKQDTWHGPETAPDIQPNKTIGIIPCAIAIEGCIRSARGAEEAAKVLGWEPIIVDGKANPQSIQEAMDSLITRHVDAILLSSVNYQDIGTQVKAAVDANILVMGIFASDPADIGGLGQVGIDDTEAGKTLAAYAAVNGGGGAVVFTQNESPSVAKRGAAFKPAYEALGGTIVAEQSVSNSQLGPPEEPIMSGILQQNPAGSIKWVFAGFDFMLTPLVNVIDRQGRDEIHGFSFDGNVENLQFIREGKVESAVVGYPLEWAGYAAIDQLNRAFAGEDLVSDTGVRFKLLTADNLPPEGQAYTGDLDFRAKYRELWGK
jgi:ribose transport system substrate-binding protein